MPCIILSAGQLLSCFILQTPPWQKCRHFLHFTFEDTKEPRMQKLAPNRVSRQWQQQNWHLYSGELRLPVSFLLLTLVTVNMSTAKGTLHIIKVTDQLTLKQGEQGRYPHRSPGRVNVIRWIPKSRDTRGSQETQSRRRISCGAAGFEHEGDLWSGLYAASRSWKPARHPGTSVLPSHGNQFCNNPREMKSRFTLSPQPAAKSPAQGAPWFRFVGP